MPRGLVRIQDSGELHFITFSCYQRRNYLSAASSRGMVADAMRRISLSYDFDLLGFVVMPNHVHVLVSEPRNSALARAIQAIKVSVAKRSPYRPLWQARYFDLNVYTDRKRIEKLNYIHWNPVKKGLVEKPEDWEWSSFRREIVSFLPSLSSGEIPKP
jgi:putative transposase